MNRQKKPLCHNETGRECRIGMRGLAGLPQAEAEVPEGYDSGQRFPLKSVQSKPQAALSSHSTRVGKEPK